MSCAYMKSLTQQTFWFCSWIKLHMYVDQHPNTMPMDRDFENMVIGPESKLLRGLLKIFKQEGTFKIKYFGLYSRAYLCADLGGESNGQPWQLFLVITNSIFEIGSFSGIEVTSGLGWLVSKPQGCAVSTSLLPGL